VHHVAFRAKDEEELAELREKVMGKGLHPSPIIDRHWFKSVYFREPSGVLFEIASDGPGYAVDEVFEELGETLILPPWLEPRRKIIEDNLPDLGI
jgi:glyoxalase family protein